MKLLHKMQTGARIVSNDGFSAFFKVLGERLPKLDKDPEESMIAFKVLGAKKKKGLLIDVGAHFGSSLAPFATAGWIVYAFEPDSQNREELVHDYGDLSNVFIDKRAVSDNQQEGVDLYRSDVSTGISGLSVFHPSHTRAETVDVTTIEQFIKEKDLSKKQIDFLKIDTEGFDIFVLKGVPWNQVKPRLIVCEFEDVKTVPLGYTFHDLAQFLVDLGYRVIVSEWEPIKEYGTPVPWRSYELYPCELKDTTAWGNLIAVHENSLFNALTKICKIKT